MVGGVFLPLIYSSFPRLLLFTVCRRNLKLMENGNHLSYLPRTAEERELLPESHTHAHTSETGAGAGLLAAAAASMVVVVMGIEA